MKLNIQSNYYLYIQYNFNNLFNRLFIQIYKYFEFLIIDKYLIEYRIYCWQD